MTLRGGNPPFPPLPMCGLREGRSLGIECNEDRLRNSEWRPTKLHRDKKKLQLVRFPHCSKFDSFEVTGKAKLQKGRKLWLRYRTEVDIFKNLNCIKIDRYGKNVFSFANLRTSLYPCFYECRHRQQIFTTGEKIFLHHPYLA